jgi:oligopeptide/dipeptide ABC transporter ATP-binding protein
VPIPGLPPSLAKVPPGCPFNPRCAFAEEACRSTYPATRTLVEDGAKSHRVRCHVTTVSKEEHRTREVAS